jgi:hypothetical protein
MTDVQRSDKFRKHLMKFHTSPVTTTCIEINNIGTSLIESDTIDNNLSEHEQMLIIL